MTLACKNAIVERDVAHLIFPDDVQTLPARRRKASGPAGAWRLRHRAARGCLDDAVSLIASRSARSSSSAMARGMRWTSHRACRTSARAGLTTFKAKGQIADDHPLAAGVLGRSGTPVASWFMNECDLILAFGSSFSNHTGITPKRPIIQVDFDRMTLGKFHGVTVPVWGEIGVTARHSTSPAADTAADRPAPGACRALGDLARRETQPARRRPWQRLELRAGVCRAQRTRSGDAVIAVDVGNNTYSFGRYFESQGQRILMSGYLGSIGFAFPPPWAPGPRRRTRTTTAGRKVVSVSGDGGFGQYMGEFNTAVKYDMDITHVLLNNAELGKISKEQRAGEWPVWQTGLHNPNFATYAKLCGGKGMRVTKAEQLETALGEA